MFKRLIEACPSGPSIQTVSVKKSNTLNYPNSIPKIFAICQKYLIKFLSKYPSKNPNTLNYLVLCSKKTQVFAFGYVSKKHRNFLRHIQNFMDTIWQIFGQFKVFGFLHRYCLDTILGHRKLKNEQLDHVDRLLISMHTEQRF